MTVEFDSPFDARGMVTPADASWRDWFQGLDRSPDYAVVWSGPSVNGHRHAPVRIGGYFLEPVESVVGLRPFDDAREGTVELDGVGPVPYVFFEFEKILRMMLHQSGLAFEILASPACLHLSKRVDGGAEPRRLITSAVTTDVLDHYRESTDGDLDDLRSGRDRSVEDVVRLFRTLATGAALADGRATLDCDALIERYDAEVVRRIGRREADRPVTDGRSEVVAICERLAERLDGDGSALPDQPEAYDELDDLLVDRRLSDDGPGTSLELDDVL